MVRVVYLQPDREELERGNRVHERWEIDRPKYSPKAIRYVVGFEHEEEIPPKWEDFPNKFPLEERVTIMSNSAPVGWEKEFKDWDRRSWEMRKKNEGKGYFVYPVEIYKEEEKIKGKLKPVSLRYATKDAGVLYRMGTLDTGKNAKTLVFYNDVLAAQMRLDNYEEGHDDSYANLIIRFENGREIKRGWSDWAPNISSGHLEKDIRMILGENVNAFELHSDQCARLLRRS